jgi:hypothetical protein
MVLERRGTIRADGSTRGTAVSILSPYQANRRWFESCRGYRRILGRESSVIRGLGECKCGDRTRTCEPWQKRCCSY